jgi:outer membrane protein OmpA-like peptidoglycan-associated protein
VETFKADNNQEEECMNMHTQFALFSAAVLSAGLMGCVTLTGSATLGTDGRTALLKSGSPLQIRAKQPALPPEPVKAKIVEERIEITEKVQFAYNEATILSASDDLLNDVATVMKQHPEVKKIRIEGHASSEGNDKYNKDLSDRRAKAVMEFLVKVGVAEDRMEAIGYGEERPIADNETEEGREKNRRVEFNIIARLSPEELAALKAGGESQPTDASTATTPATAEKSGATAEE